MCLVLRRERREHSGAARSAPFPCFALVSCFCLTDFVVWLVLLEQVACVQRPDDAASVATRKNAKTVTSAAWFVAAPDSAAAVDFL